MTGQHEVDDRTSIIGSQLVSGGREAGVGGVALWLYSAGVLLVGGGAGLLGMEWWGFGGGARLQP